MSYEGYDIALCANGHKTTRDAYFSVGPEECCEYCGERFVWFYSVDQTNDGGVEPVFEVFEEEKIKVCDCCGSKKVLAPTRYSIPFNCGRFISKNDSKVPFSTILFVDLDLDKVFKTKKEAYEAKEKYLYGLYPEDR